MKYIVYSFTALLLLVGGFMTLYDTNTVFVVNEEKLKFSEDTSDNKELLGVETKEIKIQSGDTFSTLMEQIEVTPEEQNSILTAVQDVYDFTKLHAGKLMHVVFAQDALASIDYDIDDDKKIVVENINGTFVAKEELIEYDITEVAKSVTIESSLFLDGSSAGLSDKTLAELAEIFQWDIDFATDIKTGDAFSLVYEDRKTLDGSSVRPGKIIAARFENQGAIYDAYYHENQDGSTGYYTSDGESVERQFLSSPISIGYVSSGFSYSRVNPVTKQVTPHRAIDYAAPHGTPVVAIADGEVTVAGNKGGLGITVEINHGQYLSQYAHLSKIASDVKLGETVSQGNVIGYVGSTGISTGPHLQYAFFKEGTPINPSDAELPAGESLSGKELDALQDIVNRYDTQLRMN